MKKIKNSLLKYGNSSNNKTIIKIVAFAFAVICVVYIFTKKDEPNSKKTQFRTNAQIEQEDKQNASAGKSIIIPGQKISEQAVLQKQMEDRITQLNDTNDQLTTQISKMKDQQNQSGTQYDQKIKDLNDKLDVLADTIVNKRKEEQKKDASGVTIAKSDDENQIQEIDMDSDDTQQNNTPQQISNPQQQNQSQNDKSKEEPKHVGEYIPANTVMRGNLVEGISANTGGNASGEPSPVLIKLTDLASLPNHFRVNVKECRVSGSGYGDLSTERVKIRLDRFTCILRNGNVIDVPVKGNVAGEDGKSGIRGVVITRNGSKLAMAVIAGTAGGLANAAQMATQTQQVSPIGVVNTVNPNQAFGSSIAGGAGQGMNTISTYYTNMLNQITPAIEVSSGRNVDVILQQGIELKKALPTNSEMISSDTTLPFNRFNR